MTCSESVEPFSKSLFLSRALVAESKGQESCCFFIQRPWNNLNWTSWVWQGCKMKLGFLLLYPRYRQPIELNPDDPSGPADTLIFDPGLNNRLWPASQTWLAGFLVTKLLYCTSLHSTCTRKTDFPAHGYLLLFPVCNSFFFFLLRFGGQVRGSCCHTEGGPGRLGEEKLCGSFPCEENEPRKITTRNRFM